MLMFTEEREVVARIAWGKPISRIWVHLPIPIQAAAVLGPTVIWTIVSEREIGDGVEVDVGFAPFRIDGAVSVHDIHDDACYACVRLT